MTHIFTSNTDFVKFSVIQHLFCKQIKKRRVNGGLTVADGGKIILKIVLNTKYF